MEEQGADERAVTVEGQPDSVAIQTRDDMTTITSSNGRKLTFHHDVWSASMTAVLALKYGGEMTERLATPVYRDALAIEMGLFASYLCQQEHVRRHPTYEPHDE